jgi:hypothetical protein
LCHDRHGGERARDDECSSDDVREGEAWVPHREVSHVPSAYVSAGFSPLYGKKKGASGEPRAQKIAGNAV